MKKLRIIRKIGKINNGNIKKKIEKEKETKEK